MAHLLDVVFQRTRVPDILLLMVLGALLGPIGGVIPPEFIAQIGGFLSLSTLIVILTESGLSLELQAIMRSAARSLPYSILAFVGSVIVIAILCKIFLGLDWWVAIMGGAIMGGTSASVVIPILKNVGAGEQTTTILTIESALTDVLCIIGAVGIATALVGEGGVETGGLLGGAAVSLIGAIIYGGLLGIGWSLFLPLVARLRNAMFTTLAFALVVYGSAELIGISGAIAALTFGVALGNVPENATIRTRFWSRRKRSHEMQLIPIKHVTANERRLYAEVVFLLKAFFFVYLGTTLRLESFGSALAILALVLAIIPIIPRYPIALYILARDATPRREAMLAVALGPRGMAAAVLAQLPVSMGVPNTADLAEVVTMMVFFSITIAALLVFLIERRHLDGLAGLLFRGFPVRVAAPLPPPRAGAALGSPPSTPPDQPGPDTPHAGDDAGDPHPDAAIDHDALPAALDDTLEHAKGAAPLSRPLGHRARRRRAP